MNHEVEPQKKKTSAIVAEAIKIKSLCKIMHHIFHNDRIKCAWKVKEQRARINVEENICG